MAEEKKKTKAQIFMLIAQWYLIITGLLLWGYFSKRYDFFPAKELDNVVDDFEAFIKGDPESPRSMFEKLSLHPQVYYNKFDFVGFKNHDAAFTDDGYLMLSRFSDKHDQVIVELVKIDGWHVLHTWIPPIQEILDKTYDDGKSNSFSGYRAQHPLLMPDGSIIMTSGEGPLVRLNKDSSVRWINDEHFHHSIELDHEGNLVIPITFYPPIFKDLPIRDDGYAIVTTDGEILDKRSFAQILMDNGERGLLLGTAKVEEDRVHLNDAQPILKDVGSAKVGDIAMSSRHLSTVLLYRPSTNKLIWCKVGPWFTQHDVDHLADGRFSIFGNDTIRLHEDDYDSSVTGTYSHIYLFDSKTNEVTTPYLDIMEKLGVYTYGGGLCRVLPNGDVFFEVAEAHQIVRLSPEKVRWEYVNGTKENHAAAMHWSRYITADEIDLTWLNQ